VAKVDGYLVEVLSQCVRPERVDVETAARVLYGWKPTPEVIQYIGNLLDHRPATPPG
jgi:hypothetical protein